jgi:hypothetical protein
MWRVIGRFESPDVPWAELLADLEKVQKDFPGSKHEERVKDSIAILRRMVAEEKARAAALPKAEKDMTKRERVAELIFRLREQNGHQFMQPGRCLIFGWGRDNDEQTPAHQLVRIGYGAVPQLIDALEDERFTRSVGFHRSWYFSHHVLRVGDCSLAVLQRIAGRTFYQRRTTNSEMIKDGEVAAVKLKVQAWWAECQRKGERQMLVEGVAAGTYDSPAQAEMLVKKYPVAALPAIRGGARAAANGWIRSQLIDAAASLEGDDLVAFLREELKGPPPLGPRVAAARALLRHGHRESVAAMIDEWQRLRPPGKWVSYFGGPEDGPEALVRFLAASRDVAAVRALAEGLQNRPESLRLDVIEEIGRLGTGAGEKPLAADAEEAVQALLAAALDDGGVRWGMHGTRHGVDFSDPFINDIAADVLARRWERPDAFHLDHPLRVREAERLALKNDWRNRHGLARLPAPAHWAVKTADAAELRPLLLQLSKATTAAGRKAAVEKIESLGLPALPGVRDAVRSLPPGDPAAGELGALVARLAFRVVHVRLDVPGGLSRESADEVGGWKEKPLTDAAVLGLLVSATRGTPSGSRLELIVHRPGDGTGVEVSFRARAAEARPRSTSPQFNRDQSVRVGGKDLISGSVLTAGPKGTEAVDWSELAKPIREAFQADPDQEVLIRVGWVSYR